MSVELLSPPAVTMPLICVQKPVQPHKCVVTAPNTPKRSAGLKTGKNGVFDESPRIMLLTLRANLTANERDVIMGRFIRRWTLEECSVKLKIFRSNERIRQIESDALRKIKRYLLKEEGRANYFL
jgi:hypothetical protein